MNITTNSDPAAARFARLDIGDAGPQLLGATIPDPQPLPAPAPPEIKAGEVDPEAAARCKADELLVKAAGFAPRAPIYTIGSRVNEWGVANFKASRKEFEELPLAVEAVSNLQGVIKAERREMLPVTIGQLEMLKDGRLVTPVGALPMSEVAFERFGYTIAPNAGAYLVACPPALRAENFNYWKDQKGNKDRAAQLRLRDGKAGREVFAAVGPRYAAHDADEIAGQVLEALPAGSRAEVTYDGAKARMNVLFHSNIDPEKCAAGEFFKAGVNVKTDDTGHGGIWADGLAWRNLCLNLIIIDRAKVKFGRRKHVGKTTIADDVGVIIDRAMQSVSTFAGKWNDATVENVIERYEAEGPNEVFKGLVFNKLVWVPGVSADAMVEKLQRAWDAEPGYSKTAFINAITRAAHKESWESPWTTEDLERAAGQLLYAKVWNVALPEEPTSALA